MKIKITLTYDGTEYCGWQKQKNGVSVQQTVEDAVCKITGENVKVIGSGRTDAGVHAEKQVAHFSVENSSIPPENYYKALNTVLPPDVKAIKSERVEEGFDASRSAKKKTYEYKFYFSDVLLPLKERYAERLSKNTAFDSEKLNGACKAFIGTFDFKGYCASGSSALTTVRTVYDMSAKKSGDLLILSVTGNGFLYNMVRNMAGAVISCAQGKTEISEIINSLKCGTKIQGLKTLPAKGLCLKSVIYGE